jgi:threonine synthase
MYFTYRCTDCGAEYPKGEITYRCPACGGSEAPGEMQKGNLEIVIDSDYLKELGSRAELDPDDFLPYPIPHKATYPVGDTPLVAPRRLREKTGFDQLLLKNDGMNPSGSYKDRASQVVAAQALHHGENTVTVASTGNAGSAMACAGAAYGLEVILFVPETAPENKLLQSVLYGTKVLPVKGSYDTAFALSLEYTAKYGGINRNTGFNPMTVEGKKSLSIELYKELGGKIPDYLYIPVGDGVIYSGIHKGFSDLQRAGLIKELPKLIAVQSEKSNAIAGAWRSGEMRTIERASTKADSISVASPACGRTAVKSIKSCGGWAVEVKDSEIFSAQLELAAEAGVFVEPAAAAAWAGFRRDAERIPKDAEVVILLTGIGFKDMKAVTGSVKMPEPVDPNLQAVEIRLGKK